MSNYVAPNSRRLMVFFGWVRGSFGLSTRRRAPQKQYAGGGGREDGSERRREQGGEPEE